MISILGDYYYTFPQPIPLKLKLKDMLEDEVDEKYYLSKDIANTILTAPKEGVVLNIKKDTKNYIEWEEKGKGGTQTLMTNPQQTVILGNYMPSNHNASRIVSSDYSAPTVMGNHGTITAIVENINKNAKHQQDFIQETKGNARTLVCGTHGDGGHCTKTLMDNLRIRKLTPRECFRLMGVKDEDYEKIAQNQSNSSLYHLAGDSIVIDVLMYIFNQLFLEKEKENETIKNVI